MMLGLSCVIRKIKSILAIYLVLLFCPVAYANKVDIINELARDFKKSVAQGKYIMLSDTNKPLTNDIGYYLLDTTTIKNKPFINPNYGRYKEVDIYMVINLTDYVDMMGNIGNEIISDKLNISRKSAQAFSEVASGMRMLPRQSTFYFDCDNSRFNLSGETVMIQDNGDSIVYSTVVKKNWSKPNFVNSKDWYALDNLFGNEFNIVASPIELLCANKFG